MAKVNRLKNRKKMNQDDINVVAETIIENDLKVVNIDFDYGKFDLSQNDIKTLQGLEKNLIFEGNKFKETAVNIGKMLIEAREIWSKENQETGFMEWYGKLGLAKDQVYLFTGRYGLTLEYPEKKEKIIKLSDRIVKEAIHKKTPLEIKEKVVSGELSTGVQVKQEREKYISSMLEMERMSLTQEERTERLISMSPFLFLLENQRELKKIKHLIYDYESHALKIYEDEEKYIKLKGSSRIVLDFALAFFYKEEIRLYDKMTSLTDADFNLLLRAMKKAREFEAYFRDNK